MTSPPPLCGKHSPGQNQLLAALPALDYQRLLPDLELVPMPLSWAVNEADAERRYVYFPTTCVVSKFFIMQDGSSSAIAIVGREGVLGLSLILGGGSAPTRAIVQFTGYAYRMKGAALKREFSRDGVLKSLLLRYALALIAQMAQTTACNRHHSVDQRLCRWLLLSEERLPSNQVQITQELMATWLGVRREGVTVAVGQLQQAGLIKRSRGHITILDRPALEKRGCECYAVVKKESGRLLSYRDASLSNRPLWSIPVRQNLLAIEC